MNQTLNLLNADYSLRLIVILSFVIVNYSCRLPVILVSYAFQGNSKSLTTCIFYIFGLASKLLG